MTFEIFDKQHKVAVGIVRAESVHEEDGKLLFTHEDGKDSSIPASTYSITNLDDWLLLLEMGIRP